MTGVESNMVFGMYSGLALLMDLYHPERSNGYGIIQIAGSGWHRPLSYDAAALKDVPQVVKYTGPLVEAGYTVFAINHRAAPRFKYPAALEDAQRAVRYVRFHAERFGIRPDRIGGSGGSSGAHLVSLLGVLGGQGDPADPDPVDRESARVQCVVARAAPTDFLDWGPGRRDEFVDFLGMTVTDASSPTSMEYKRYREASPLYHVTKDAPPFLLIHGDADNTVPFQNSERMREALDQAGVKVKLLRIEGAGHGPDFPGAKNPPDYLGEMVRWFDTYLRS
ncbi:MAG: alpha/beta hydrolase [Dehalococcoidia bacterium]|nr:alpha/beta hydrolase [Dehalococcoidia bacterium]